MNKKNSKFLFLAIFVVGLIVGFFLKGALDNSSPVNSKDLNTQSQGVKVSEQVSLTNQMEPEISLLNYRFDKETDFAFLKGEVKNISNRDLSNIEIIGNVYDKNNHFLDSARGYLELSPLLPKQSSGFKVTFKLKPEMQFAKVSGFQAGSLQVPFRDDFIQKQEENL